MRHSDHRIVIAFCVLSLMVASGCSQPNSGTRFEPQITARHDGFFSYDITFTLNGVNQVDWSRGDDNQVTTSETPVGADLREVSVNIIVHYSQGATHETQAFDANWHFGENLTVNVPMTAAIQGYDIEGTGYVFDESDTLLGTVPIKSSFRTTSK